MIRALSLSCLLSLLPAVTRADAPGAFDYYVLSLSWSPTWCALEGDDRDAPQCAAGQQTGWSLHGLWPQYESGYPDYCTVSRETDPSRRQSDAMADIMGSGGLAWYQWKKHGRCSGLTGPNYYALSRRAYDSITRPPLLRQLDHSVSLPATVIEDAFLEVNPTLTADMITITCDSNRIGEARICLTKDLTPRVCGADVRRDCGLQDALFDPIR
ncbi:ribonuclease T2 [Pseudoruegeria sp. SK021]|uniref:ribonuclease T2 family protein n=1 Tax=Pseudoruegeria sp. SK021 TaxID=1933035 RepID=UPI000A240E07|nr:ribonuclease T2 [Pseudoruegeria sp. SK021]OSP56760.1 ribonuclease T [Pseudoruegeria sp. SK021]